MGYRANLYICLKIFTCSDTPLPYKYHKIMSQVIYSSILRYTIKTGPNLHLLFWNGVPGLMSSHTKAVRLRLLRLL